jgi:hypothetical protein
VPVLLSAPNRTNIAPHSPKAMKVDASNIGSNHCPASLGLIADMPHEIETDFERVKSEQVAL